MLCTYFFYLEVLRWARENGCPWDERTCSLAANGRLETLRWAVAEGCPWDPAACRVRAANSGHVEAEAWIDEWLREDLKEPEGA